MSWASIVHSSKKQTLSPSLKVQYSDAFKKVPQMKTDNIPRHKEVEADPGDDFEMTNIENEKKDNSYLEDIATHPYSLLCFIKWVHNIENESKLIDLNFDKIDKDLQLQCSLYKQQDLKKMYYNFDWDICDFSCEAYKKIRNSNQHNKRYFSRHDSIIHYILKVPFPTNEYFDDHKKWDKKQDSIKFVEQSAMILKLLIKNKIISTSEPIRIGTYGRSIYERIGDELMLMDTQFVKGDKTKQKCIDIYFELLLFCINERNKRTDIPTEAMLHLHKRKGVNALSIWSYKNMFADCTYTQYMTFESKSFISNKTKIIQRLLFRGIPPFSLCIDWTYNNNSQTKQCYDLDTNVFDKYFIELICIQPNNKNDIKIFDKAVICSPLIIFPYLKQAKAEMFNIIYDCIERLQYVNVFIKELVDIILVYVYCGSKYDFYDQQFYQNNELSIKVFELFGYIGQVSMDENSLFDTIFNERFNNLQFAAFIIENYSIEIITMFIRESYNANMEYLLKLFKLYPPSLTYYYYLLFGFVERGSDMAHCDEQKSRLLIKFLKHVEYVYPTTFDINHTWYDDHDESIRLGSQLINNLIDTFVSDCWKKDVGRNSLRVIKYIISHTNINLEGLLNFILTRQYISVNLISTVLVKNAKYENYSVKTICNEIVKWESNCKTKSMGREELNSVLKTLNSYLSLRNSSHAEEDEKKVIKDTIGKLHHWQKKIKIYRYQ